MTATADKTDLEPVEEFRLRTRKWFADNMRRLEDVPAMAARSEDHWAYLRTLQRKIWDGGFAGVCWPAEYGGLGLTPEHQRAFNEESLPYEMPTALNVPTFGILAATLIDFGTHEQKARHLPAILRGDELWVQFLSEPTGGSDLAGCVTRADRDGDVFIMNGSKIWSSGAAVSDYAMCLARTNWDVPKHRGLTMFIIKIHQPGIQIEPIRQVNGSMEFCQEFFDDVSIPVADVVGQIDDGWNVASRLLVHERMAVGGASPYTAGRAMSGELGGPDTNLVKLAREVGVEHDPVARQVVANFHVEHLVHHHLSSRITRGMATGEMPPPAGSVLKLSHAMLEIARAQAAVEIGGDAVSVGGGLARQLGDASLLRQGISLGGGSNEIQRNIISERVLAMPREWAADREVAYKDVKRNAMPTGPK